jgi:hypothetical protein
VLLEREPGNIYRVCKILRREGDAATAARAVAVREQLQRELRKGAGSDIHALIFGEPVALTMREVLNAWLYTANFHDEGDHEAAYQALSAYAECFHVAVQFAVLQVAGCVLDMDDVVADYLGEARLPRIMTEATN